MDMNLILASIGVFLVVILFEKMGMPAGKKTKNGYSTAADVLEMLAKS